MSSSAYMRGTCIDPNSAHATYVHVLKLWITELLVVTMNPKLLKQWYTEREKPIDF
jgi:hypothetical protein